MCRDLLKQLQPPHVDLSLICCLPYSAIGFMRVTAVGKAALPKVGQKFPEASFYCGKIQMMQAEQLHAGAVDDGRRPDAVWRSLLVREGRLAAAPANGRFAVTCRRRADIQMIQARVRGGVFAGIEYGGNLACGCECIGDEGVDEG